MISLNKRSSKAALKPNAEHRDEALAAIEQEGDQFVANRVLSAPMTYAEIPVEHRTNILKVFQFVVDKHDASGVFVKCKARSVADGSAQAPGTYGESTAPVMSALACKLLLAMAATLGMKIASIDIATAFCLTPNPYEVYLELPDALEKRFGKYVRMLKCVYGTRQAAHQFYMMMRGGLERAGYEACDDDAGLFRKVKSDGSFVLIGLHVDDSLIVYNSDEELQDIVDAMSATFGKDKVKLDLWPSSLLGLTLTYHVDGSIGVGQQGYVDTVCERFSSYLTDKSEKYPHDGEGLRVRTDERRATPLDSRMAHLYQELVGCLGYAAITRACIQPALTYLQSRAGCPSVGDWERALRMLRYLRGTREHDIRYPGPPGADAHPDEIATLLQLWATCDANHNSYDDGRGVTGLTLSLGPWKPTILCKALKQGSVGLSSTFCEYYGYGDACAVIVWARRLAGFCGCDVSAPTPLENDNEAALSLAMMPFTGKGVKHAGSRVHYFKEAIWDGEVVLVWRPTDDLLADLLTKPLMGDKFATHDERARKGVLWNDRPALPKQPNSVFEKGLRAGVLAVRELNDRMNVEGLESSGSDGVLD
jgi:hypothetical protein